MTSLVIPIAWLALEALRSRGETLSIPEMVLYLQRATALRWTEHEAAKLIPMAYRAHGIPGRAPIRYDAGDWVDVPGRSRPRRRKT